MKIEVPIHSSVILNGNIYFDPYNLKKPMQKAKIVFVTHSHYDHFSLDDIKKIATDETEFVATEDVAKELKKVYKNVTTVVPSKEYSICGIKFSTIPAYNKNKAFHPKNNGWVGYNVTIEGENVVVCGDTDKTNELLSQKADILFIPIGGVYTMDVKEAADATNMLKPKLVIPIHYGSIVGDRSLGDEFKLLVDKDIKVEIKL